jgi:hypothetical protein
MARTLVLAGVCVSVLVLGAPGLGGTAYAAPRAAGGNVSRAVAEPKPEIAGGLDGKRAWLVANYRGLAVRKTSNQADKTVGIELRHGRDLVGVTVDASGVVTVSRGGHTIAVDSAGALMQVQSLLGGSEAVFAARMLLSEREARSELKAPEMSLLASAALVAALVGDTDAPSRLTTRFVEKHRGVFRPIRFGCWEYYTSESSAAWDDLQNCMSEANQDPSIFNGAYRRLGCNALWLGRAESVWFTYLNCISPLAALAG